MVSAYRDFRPTAGTQSDADLVNPFRVGAEYYRDFAKVYDTLKRLHAEAPAMAEQILLDMTDRRTAKDLAAVAAVLGYWAEIFGVIAVNAEKRGEG